MLIKRFSHIRNIFLRTNWKDIEYFDESWINRMKVMVKYIPENASILDLGCGPMWLKDLIKCKAYYPVDYKFRSDNTIICDFNKKEFPDQEADYAFVGGCLEYIRDYKWFISQIAKYTHSCVISYCCIEQIPDINIRRKHAWVNDLTKEQIVEQFTQRGMNLIAEDKYLNSNVILIFNKISE